MSKKDLAVLVDGTNLFTIHFVANPSTDMNGNPAGGIKGFLNELKRITYKLKPSKIICVFDGEGGSTKRRKRLKEYKGGRKPISTRKIVGRYYQFADEDQAFENQIWQMKTLKKCLKPLPVCTITTENIEADDAIAYIVNHSDYFEHKANIIVTCDKDFYQLVKKGEVLIYNPVSKKLITEDLIIKEHGIHPDNWLFYRAIDGDKSDNIEGVKGFGPKTIKNLFDLKDNTFAFIPERLQEFYLDALEKGDEKKEKKYNKLIENKDTIERNWKLMSLQKDDILMNVNDKDKVADQVSSFKPSLNVKQLYLTLTKLGLSIESNFGENFRGLI